MIAFVHIYVARARSGLGYGRLLLTAENIISQGLVEIEAAKLPLWF